MLGVHFAITADQERAFLAADEDEVGDLLEELEESWGEPDLKVDTDKAWAAVHRCLAGGTVDPDAGEFPLSHAVLGGRHLHTDYYVVYVSAAEVREVTEALLPLTREWLRERYDLVDQQDYGVPLSDEDFNYTWTNFEDLRAFYTRASAAGRPVLFTAT